MRFPLFLSFVGALFMITSPFAAEPRDNEAVRTIALRIKNRLAGEEVRTGYTGTYLIWAWGTADEVREAIAAGADPRAWEPQLPARENPHHRRTMPALAIAALNNPDAEVIDVLIAAGADPNTANSSGETPLHLAAGAARPEVIRRLLYAGASAGATEDDGANAFHFLLASAGLREPSRIAESVTILLEAGLDPNAAMPNGTTPLHFFAERVTVDDAETAAGLLPALQTFIAGGADVHRRTEGGYEPVWGLSRRHIGYDQVGSARLPAHLVRLLIDLGFDINSQNNNGSTIMMHCAGHFTQGYVLTNNLLHDFTILLDAGADPDIRDRRGKTAFDYLHPNAKRILLESVLGKRMGSPFKGFFAVCADGTIADLERAIAAGADIETGDPEYLDTPPLALAAFRNSSPETVALLLNRGAKPDQFNAHGMTALHFAAVAGNVNAARLLLEAGANPDAKDYHEGYVPLHYAMRDAIPEKAAELGALIRMLTDAGANPNAPDRRGRSPLHEFLNTASLADEAAYKAFLPLLQDFVGAGADPDAIDDLGRTPVFEVFKTFKRRLPSWKVRLMAELGCNLNHQDARGETLLARTVRTFTSRGVNLGHQEIWPGMVIDLDFLLDLGADPHLQDGSGHLPYHYFSDEFPTDHPLTAKLKVHASHKGKYGTFAKSTPEEVREALAAGFDPNGLNYMQMPYLIDAIENPDAGVLAFFLQAGADPNRGGKDGRTPLMAAADLHKSSAMAELLRYGARADARDNIGMEAMHALFRKLHRITEADSHEFVACLRLLLEAGANPKAKSNYGQTPFDLFMHHLRADPKAPDLSLVARVLRELTVYGVDFFHVDENGMSAPLRALCEQKVPWRVIDLYRELGWDVNETHSGYTPLMRAASSRNTAIHYGKNKVLPENYVASGVVDELADLFAGMIERGADPAIRSELGITALEHLAPELREHLVKPETR